MTSRLTREGLHGACSGEGDLELKPQIGLCLLILPCDLNKPLPSQSRGFPMCKTGPPLRDVGMQ